MADSLEQLTYPFRVGPGGTIVTVEQDSDEDLESCLTTILKWPAGTRELNPDFGTPEQAFLNGGADLDEIRQALMMNEVRAIESAVVQDDSQLANFISAVTVGWDPAGGGSEL